MMQRTQQDVAYPKQDPRKCALQYHCNSVSAHCIVDPCHPGVCLALFKVLHTSPEGATAEDAKNADDSAYAKQDPRNCAAQYHCSSTSVHFGVDPCHQGVRLALFKVLYPSPEQQTTEDAKNAACCSICKARSTKQCRAVPLQQHFSPQ